jgi:MFS family permease
MSKQSTNSSLRNFLIIWLGQLVSGIGSSMTGIALEIWAWSITGKATTLALVAFFSLLPSIIITPISGVIVDRFNRKLLMMLGDTVAVLTTIVLLFLYINNYLQIWHIYIAAAFVGTFGQFQYLAYSASVALLFNLGNSSDAFLLLQAQQVGVSPTFVPLTIVVMNVTYFLSAYPVGLLSDRIGRLGLLVGGFLLYALTYLGFAFTSTSWQIWVLFALYGLYQGMNKGIFSAMVAEKVPANLRGTAFGFINLATGIALLIANILAGSMWQLISPQVAFITGSVFAVVAIAILLTKIDNPQT